MSSALERRLQIPNGRRKCRPPPSPRSSGRRGATDAIGWCWLRSPVKYRRRGRRAVVAIRANAPAAVQGARRHVLGSGIVASWFLGAHALSFGHAPAQSRPDAFARIAGVHAVQRLPLTASSLELHPRSGRGSAERGGLCSVLTARSLLCLCVCVCARNGGACLRRQRDGHQRDCQVCSGVLHGLVRPIPPTVSWKHSL